jgi:hypothetical protein
MEKYGESYTTRMISIYMEKYGDHNVTDGYAALRNLVISHHPSFHEHGPITALLAFFIRLHCVLYSSILVVLLLAL